MNRLTLRGRVKVNTQWQLYWLVHYISNMLALARTEAGLGQFA